MTWLSDLLVEITPEHPLAAVDAALAAALATDPTTPLVRHLAATHELPDESWSRLVRHLRARVGPDGHIPGREELPTVLLTRPDCPLAHALEIVGMLSASAALDLARTGQAFKLSDPALTRLLVTYPQAASARLDALVRSRPEVFDEVLRSFLPLLDDATALPARRSGILQVVRAGLADELRATWMAPLLPVRGLRALRPLPAPAKAAVAALVAAELGHAALRWHTVFALSDEFGGTLGEILLAATQMDS